MAVLQDTTYLAPEFAKGAYRRVISFPGRIIRRYQPFFIYYEIYHLDTSRGRHWLRIDQKIYSTDAQGRQKECLINTDPIESTETGDTYRGCQKIHLLSEDLPTGRYLLKINAMDQIAGRTTSLMLEFILGGEAVLEKRSSNGDQLKVIDLRNRRRR